MKHLVLGALVLSIPAALVACSGPAGRAMSIPADDLVIPVSQQWAGLNTPEAAATELFEAYIALDAERFRRACAKPFGDVRTRAHYQAFIDGAAQELREARTSGMPPDGAPVSLVEVRGAYDLPSTFRTAAAYDQMAQRTAAIVEVDAWLAGRGVETSRVIVLKDSGGTWGAAPRPELFGFSLR